MRAGIFSANFRRHKLLAALPLAITGTPPAASSGVPYSWTPTISGGTTPYSVSVATGTLPSWASLNTSTGTVSGTPSGSGTASFTLRVTDNTSATQDLATSITTGSAPDYTVTNWTALNNLIGPSAATDLTGKTLLVDGNCSGAAITLTNRTWPGLTIIGPSPDARQLMPRLLFTNVNGASGSPITFRWLDFYNVRAAGEGQIAEGQITITGGTSSYLSFDECTLRDDPFTTKSFKGGSVLEMYWGFARTNNGFGQNITVTNCEIYNVVRSIFYGDTWTVHDNDWHDHYNHAATVEGSNMDVQRNRCWNLWAAPTDTNDPHAGVGFSPSPIGTGDCANISIIGNVMIPGTARKTYDGTDPGASGVKFNDMQATGFRYRGCIVRGNLIVGSDTIMLEMDCGTDCIIEDNTLVHDEALAVASPSLYINDAVNVIVRNNIFSTLVYGALGRGSGLHIFNNGYAQPHVTGATNLLAYANVFAGATFSSIATVEEALAAFALKSTHPLYSWAIPPGALANYDFTTNTYSGAQQAGPVSSNATSRTQSLVTKPNNAWVRTPTSGTGVAAWKPNNLRKFTFLFNVSNDATIDASSRYLFFVSSSTRCYVQRNASGLWRVTLRDAAGLILDFTSTIATTSADGVRAVIISIDLDQAKVQMAFSGSGAAIIDVPTPSTLLRTDYEPVGRVATVGTDNLSTEPGNNFAGQMDAVLIEDQFADMWTDTGLSKFFNTTGGLVSLGTNGQNPFGSTPAIFLSGNAAAWNGSGFNLGDGVGSTGTATTFTKGGSGSFS